MSQLRPAWIDAQIEAVEAAVKSRSPSQRTIEWWQGHFDADVHKRFSFQGPVLDVGCGTGEKDIIFARSGLEVHGFDAGGFCIEVAEGHRDQEPPEVRERLHFTLADARRRWPWPNDSFGTVFSSDVLEHLSVEHNTHFFQEIKRVLKPGGSVLVIVPQGKAWNDPTHVQRFDVRGMQALVGEFVNTQITVKHKRITLWGQCK